MMQGFAASSFAVTAFSVAAFALSPVAVPVPEPAAKVQHSSTTSEASLRIKTLRKERDRLAELKTLHLHQDDQLATELIVALVTKGFFNVC